MEVQALFISDVHIGSKGSNAIKLCKVLREYKPKEIFIIGDFIDGWLLRRRWYWRLEYTLLIKQLMELASNGTKIIYVTGNHDDFLRQFTPITFHHNIEIVDEYEWRGYYISHGDLYDGVVKLKWLGKIGSVGYEFAIWVDRIIKKLGYKKSFSKWLKNTVKDAVKFVTDFENQLGWQAKKRNCIGVICGHIHTPVDKIIRVGDEPIRYLNCGDWIENNSYIVFDKDFKIYSYE
jgi:UDP-2,3-diacylglucosamine pyrophosphatase LpxH